MEARNKHGQLRQFRLHRTINTGRWLPTPVMTPLILIVEDEPDIADILCAYLRRSGMRTAHAKEGRQGLDMQRTLKPDLMLVDVQMPLMDGWHLLSQVRTHSDVPIIMLTAMDQDIDKLTGLRMGADDYIVKPFNPAEVVARIQAVLRRASLRGPLARSKTVVVAGPFEIDSDSHIASVRLADRVVRLELTPTEFKLLAELMTAPTRVFSRERLLANCLPEGETLERTVDSHISKLRRKLEDLGFSGIPVAVRGVGYKLGTEP